jgi:hypothetical protein
VFCTLGRFDELKASGRLDALIRSGLRHCEKFAVIDAHAAGETEPVAVRRIGAGNLVYRFEPFMFSGLATINLRNKNSNVMGPHSGNTQKGASRV